MRLRRADGAYRWFLVRAEPVRDAAGAIARWVGTDVDIDEGKRRAAELERLVAERTADRNALWQLSRDLMLRCTFEGVITAVNPAWTEILGWREDELLGRNLSDLVHPDDAARPREGVRDLSRGMSHARFDNRYRARDGSYRWIAWSTRPSEDLINAVGRDVTAERERAEALARTEAALRQAQKMEAVGQLTGGLAHDFNNMLAGIAGSLEMMQTRVLQGRTGELDRYIAAAQGAAKRAAALTHRLLAFSRRQTLDPKPTDVNRLVAGMEELVRRTVGPPVTVEVAAAGGLWPTLVDPSQLENALLNLCINARDAMPGGGRIVIETCNRWLDHRAAAERDVAPGQYVSICVSDDGTGMTPDVVAKAFDPFFTTKPLGEGTGLGLSMIYGFVRQSGGQARIYSEVGRGTTVCLYLPRHLGEAEAEVSLPDLAHAPRAEQGETVLVVDDRQDVAELARTILRDFGYTVLMAGSGKEALEILDSSEQIDLLFTDMIMPGGMNGVVLAREARRRQPRLKVLLATGYAEASLERTDVGGSEFDILNKPYRRTELIRRVRAILDGPTGVT